MRALGWGPGDEVLTSPFSFVASANCLLYEGARPVFCDVDPVTLNLDPAAAEAALGERTRRHPAGPHLRLPGGDAGAGGARRAATASGSSRTPARRSARSTPRAAPVGARGNLATFAFYANKQMTTGEGGMIVPSDAEAAARLRSERNQGRAADMGWLDHERARLQLPPLRRSQPRSASPSSSGSTQMLERRAPRSRATTRTASARSTGLETPPGRDAAAERRSWFVYIVRLPERADRDAVIARLGERGIATKAYLPCIHLFPHLRELGYGEGQFPVAEAAAARSLALPFFPAMTESQVGRVCEALAEALR